MAVRAHLLKRFPLYCSAAVMRSHSEIQVLLRFIARLSIDGDVSLLQNSQTGSGLQPAFYSKVNGRVFLGVKTTGVS